LSERLYKERFKSLLLNERAFHLLFCELKEFPENLTLYSNLKFAEDPIFNHFILSDSLLDSEKPIPNEKLESVFERVKLEERNRSAKESVFVEDFWRRRRQIEEFAIDSSFVVSDRMEVLSKPLSIDTKLSSDSSVTAYSSTNFEIWNDVFIQSYSIPFSWKDELLSREKSILSKGEATFVLADLKTDKGSETAGCLLTFKKPDTHLGIYCVGTIPEHRGHGVAKAMLSFAERIAQDEGCNTMTLQTLTSDSVSPMYKKLGYSTEFNRDILLSRP
jgi:GNAT superfamily N-acetyltransferase